MRLSIWQQFSSNHSTAFRIVATFETPEIAKEAAEEVRSILVRTARADKDLDEWHRWARDLAAVDVEMEQEYGVPWKRHIDWVLNMQHAKRVVRLVDCAIYLCDYPGYSNGRGYRPFIELLQGFGGDVIADHESGYYDPVFMLTCTAPDEATAQKIVDSIEVKTEQRRNDIIHIYQVPNIKISCAGGELVQDKQQLTFKDIYWSAHHEYDHLIPLILYLKGYGCTHFRVQFRATSQLDTYQLRREYNDQWIELDEESIKLLGSSQFNDVFTDPNFTTIAAFDTPERAQEIANELRRLINDIVSWASQNPEEANQIWEFFWERLTPPEIDFQQQYGVIWQKSLYEWIREAQFIGRHMDAVNHFDNLVLVMNTADTQLGDTPFYDHFQKLNAVQIWRKSPFVKASFRIDLTCHAPNVETAVLIDQQIIEPELVPVWFHFYGGRKVNEDTINDAKLAAEYREEYRQYEQELARLGDLNSYTEDGLTTQQIEIMLKYQRVAHPDTTEFAQASRRLEDVVFTIASIQQTENILRLENVDFGFNHAAQGFPALIAWLRSYGCHVDYQIISIENKK